MIKVCEQCGVEYDAKRYSQKYCSKKCYYKSMENSIIRTCIVCGNEFKVWPSCTKNGFGKHCSKKCATITTATKQRSTRVKKICPTCGKEYEIWPSLERTGKGKFCSAKCYGVWISENKSGENNPNWNGGKYSGQCLVCGKEFSASRAQSKNGGGKFCSRKCSAIYNKNIMVGPNNPNWTGGGVLKQCLVCGKDTIVSKFADRNGGGQFCSRKCFSIWRTKEDDVSHHSRRSIKYRRWQGAVLRQDNFKCIECNSHHHLNAHHIQSWSENPEIRYMVDNGVTLCVFCHSTHHPKQAKLMLSRLKKAV